MTSARPHALPTAAGVVATALLAGSVALGGGPAGTGLASAGVLAVGAALWRQTARAVRITRAAAPALSVLSALEDASRGERRAELLCVQSDGLPAADAWNSVVREMERLQDECAARELAAGAAAGGERRGNASRALRGLPVGVLLVDAFGAIGEANPAAAAALGADAAELVGVQAAEVFADPAVAQELSRVRAGEVLMATLDTAAAGGAAYAVLLRAIGSARGEREVLVVLEDVTRRRRAEASHGAFVANTAHELRTPLTNIRLYVEEAIEAGAANREVTASALNVIQTETRRLERMVQDMLSVAEIESGAISIHPRETNLAGLLEDLEADFRAAASGKGLTLAFELPPKLPKAMIDKDRVQIALQNLIGNAIKYTDIGGSVRVVVACDETEFAVAVQDTGIGIAPEEQEKVFDRFTRSTDERATARVGTGLGLCIAREIARRHGGDVTLDSRFGEGSTFTLRIPLAGSALTAA